MKCVTLALVLAGFGSNALAQATPANLAVDGTWVISMTLMDNPLPDTCTLKAEGARLKGVCTMPNGEADILGDIDGVNVAWRHSADLGGNAIAYSFKGKLEDDGSMSGTMGIDAFNVSTPFTAKKLPEKKS